MCIASVPGNKEVREEPVTMGGTVVGKRNMYYVRMALSLDLSGTVFCIFDKIKKS